jgi:hypothetical protein
MILKIVGHLMNPKMVEKTGRANGKTQMVSSNYRKESGL